MKNGCQAAKLVLSLRNDKSYLHHSTSSPELLAQARSTGTVTLHARSLIGPPIGTAVEHYLQAQPAPHDLPATRLWVSEDIFGALHHSITRIHRGGKSIFPPGGAEERTILLVGFKPYHKSENGASFQELYPPHTITSFRRWHSSPAFVAPPPDSRSHEGREVSVHLRQSRDTFAIILRVDHHGLLELRRIF